MNITKVDSTNFQAGNVVLTRIKSAKSIKCYDLIKKLAQDKDIDIFISKCADSKSLPNEDMYLVVAKKEVPIEEKSFVKGEEITKQGIGYALFNKNISRKILSENVYNATMKAIKTLEEKLVVQK